MRSHGAKRFYAKQLAPNDNSKNQVYLGGDFSALNIIPHGDIATNEKSISGSKRDRLYAPVSFSWINEDGIHDAPSSKLILYPKYPEVRMSGFLKGCKKAPSKIMASRNTGRILFIGVSGGGQIFGFASEAHDEITIELLSQKNWESNGVFIEIPPNIEKSYNTKSLLIEKLREIHSKQWIVSKKMNSDGKILPYKARNGGGYTLEAELGIAPNSYSEPDYLGWEIKQYGVKDFINYRAKSPVTLMTPEPTGGIYKSDGIEKFLERFGYPDRNGKKGRINFGGIYSCAKSNYHPSTGLKLVIDGYDPESRVITKANGNISLISVNGEVAAQWDFGGIMNHWGRKHSQAAYIPSIYGEPPPMYQFGSAILVCEFTNFFLFLQALSTGVVYYDPAIKMESSSSTTKRRSQFRIKQKDLISMYKQSEIVHLD